MQPPSQPLDPSRRRFLTEAARSFLGLSLLPLQSWPKLPGDLPGPQARKMIFLYMNGGMSHLDTLDPKPGAATQGETEVLGTKVDGIQLSAHFQNLVGHVDKFALIRSLHSTQGAHATGRYFLHTSFLQRGTIRHPSLGAWLSKIDGPLHPNLPAHVAVNAGNDTASAGFLSARHNPLPIGDPGSGLQHSRRPNHVDDQRAARRLDRLQAMNQKLAKQGQNAGTAAYAQAYEQALKLMQSRDLQAFQLDSEPQWLKEAYGQGRFGQGCLLARRLVEHDVRFVEVGLGGWDTHNDNFDRLAELVPELDQALSALLADLQARGLLEETLVVLASEFGRTPKINDRTGRDHFPQAFSALLAGGGIRGGQVHGQTDATGENIVADPVSIPDFNATLAYGLGLPLEKEYFSPSGRPFRVADKGRPVRSLFA
ncbi:MAG: DUF1501 domain-containing protein [Planctomycetota bacterium]|nr:MAG: DUF1501 domain-containing protein [Planctomycetota bacterium]